MCTFSFVCPKEKDTKKKGHGLRLRCYSDTAMRRRGSNSLRSNKSPLTCAWQYLRLTHLRLCPKAARYRTMHHRCYVMQPRNISPIHTEWSPGLTVGALSVESVFGVKKGRLFERSEFLPFSWKYFRSSPGSAALIFSLVSFFCIKAKESTIGYFFFFFRLPPKNKYINLHDITFSSIFAQF